MHLQLGHDGGSLGAQRVHALGVLLAQHLELALQLRLLGGEGARLPLRLGEGGGELLDLDLLAHHLLELRPQLPEYLTLKLVESLLFGVTLRHELRGEGLVVDRRGGLRARDSSNRELAESKGLLGKCELPLRRVHADEDGCDTLATGTRATEGRSEQRGKRRLIHCDNNEQIECETGTSSYLVHQLS